MGTLLDPDQDTKSFVEYVQSCKSPSVPYFSICTAYDEITGFYVRTAGPSAQKSLLHDAFTAHRHITGDELCHSLSTMGPVLTAISDKGDKSPYYKSLTKPSTCDRRCTELDKNEDAIVRPICKVLLFELQEIEKRRNAVAGELSNANASKQADNKSINIQENINKPAITPPAQKKEDSSVAPSSSLVVAPMASNITFPALVQNATLPTEEKAKPISITPESNPQLAEDVQPLAPLAVSQTPIKVSTSSTSTADPADYSNVIVPNNNNEPFNNNNNIDNAAKQSQQPAPNVNNGGSLGSLDNDAMMPDAGTDPLLDEEAEDANYKDPDEEQPIESNVSDLSDNNVKNKNKSTKQENAVGAEEEVSAKHKKPMQVGDSFEVEGQRLEEQPIRHSQQRAEMVQEDPFYEETDSNFFAYFMFLMAACVLCYVAYHNKKKVLALLLEGRRGSSGRGGGAAGGRRGSSRGSSSSRKHTAAYQKLDSNLEEAITSTGQSRTSQIIY